MSGIDAAFLYPMDMSSHPVNAQHYHIDFRKNPGLFLSGAINQKCNITRGLYDAVQGSWGYSASRSAKNL